MRIAILGGGFAGLATAWHLLQLQLHCEIVLFDPAGIGGGSSGIAAGLVHPYAGAHAKLNRLGHEGVAASLRLLNDSSAFAKSLSDQPVYLQNGFLRVAVSAEQEACYQTSSIKYPNDITWLSAEETAAKFSGILAKPSIYIKSAIEVNTPLYLKGLWLSCEKKGAVFTRQAIKDLDQLSDFDVTIIAAGGSCKQFSELDHLSLYYTKGQVLELEWPEGLPQMPFPINSHVYLVMKPDGKSCIVGATYEKEYADADSDLKVAVAEILPRAIELIPELAGSKVLACYSGIRVSTPDHMPLVKQFAKNRWVITGFGSKGLLYHALYAERLARAIMLC